MLVDVGGRCDRFEAKIPPFDEVRFFNRALLSRVGLLGCSRQGFVVVWVTLLYAVGRGGAGALQAWVGTGRRASLVVALEAQQTYAASS
jgi:hypothetical protein